MQRNHSPRPVGHPSGTANFRRAGGGGIEPFISYGTSEESGDIALSENPELAATSIALNFVDTDVREFARILFSELLRRPDVVDQKISGTVTLRSGGEVNGNVALAMARKALEASGNSIVLSYGVYHVTGARDAASTAGNVATFSLRHIGAETAIAAVQPMVEGRAQLLRAGASSISARGDAETLVLIESLCGPSTSTSSGPPRSVCFR